MTTEVNSQLPDAGSPGGSSVRLGFESAKDYATFLLDPQGNVKSWNPGAQRIKGYSPEEIVGRHFSCFYTAEDLANGKPEKELQVARTDGFYQEEGVRVRKDGSTFHAAVTITALYDASQTLIGFAKVSWDIGELKRREEVLLDNQFRLAGIVASAFDAIITVDNDQRIVLFNRAAEKMFLCPAADALGKSLDHFLPERFRSVHSGHIRSFGETGVPTRSMGGARAVCGLRTNGEEFPIEASISQLRSGSEKQNFFTVILRDITERQSAEEVLKEQARILDLAPVMIRDRDDRIVLWNTGAQNMYGWSREEASGQVTHELLQTEFPAPLAEIHAELAANDRWEGELSHRRKDGVRIVVASQWVVHRDSRNEMRAVLEINNDITVRREMEAQVLQLNDELEQRVLERTNQLQAVNKELEAFSYSVSHDLRAPLRGINGFSQALLEDYGDQLDDIAKGYLKEVCDASQEMGRLIEDVLRLARVSRAEMHLEDVDLSDLAEGIIVVLRRTEPGRTVQVQIQPGLVVKGDTRLLEILLSNLLGNAWKFTARREKAEIVFATEERDGRTVYFVRDNGAGFDMAYRDKLFRTFQRLHSGKEFEGTGIGLATVQRIVLRHGGEVSALGAVDRGATISFTIPD